MANEAAFTHEVVMTLRSNNDDTGVSVEIAWNPELTGADYKALGYQPPVHKFVERVILPALEQAYMENNHPELFEAPKGKAN